MTLCSSNARVTMGAFAKIVAATIMVSHLAPMASCHPTATTRGVEWIEDIDNYVDLSDGIVCGMDTRQRKVVGGKNAGFGTFPFIVSLKMKNSLKHVCGGAIISENYVLTAAHCVTNYLAPRLTVAVSEHDLSSSAFDQSYEINPNRVIRHKYYNSRTFENDIALIRLKTPLKWSKNVRPICLSNNTAHYEHGRLATVAGWGRVGEGSRGSPSVLQTVEVPLVETNACKSLLDGHLPVFDKQICAGYPEGRKDACQGDSGGPLVIREGGRVYLVGVVSVGVGCARAHLPGVYTKISSYIDWISRNMT